MIKKELQKAKTISYGDLLSQLFLWQKALMLTPIWAIALVPVVGFICRGFGDTAFRFGFGLVLAASFAYFLEDMLKRKIRIDDERLYFGFQSVLLKSISSIDIIYKRNHFLPSALSITCHSGQKMKFKLDGMSEAGVDTLIKQLQSSNSNLKTAAVLNTLIKCRSVKARPQDTAESLTLAYHSRQFLLENIDVFKATAGKWVRVGPVLACVLSEPLWMSWVSGLYASVAPRKYVYHDLNPNVYFNDLFNSFFNSLSKAIGNFFEAGAKFAADPLVALLSASLICFFAFLISKLLLQANLLIADKQKLKLILRLGNISISLASINWDDVSSLSHEAAKGNSAGSLLITLKNKSKKRINLACIDPEERSLLLARLQKHLPAMEIDSKLSQAMLPKSDRSYTEIWLQSLNQAPERKSLDPLAPGQLAGENRFEVLRSLGVGGQGTAYLCRDLNSEKPGAEVVLKETIIPVFADRSIRRKALESFEKEASLLKSLDFPGVVKLLDYFVEDHRAYLVLEHVDGCSLQDLVKREGALPEAQVRDLALQMCEILNFLHANEVVHRDFTPDNLILNSKGKLKLIDFNVAQQIQEGNSGTIVGKHSYLPPEQFRGKACAQSDLYSMGASLYYLLTGKDPEPISQAQPRLHKEEVSEEMNALVNKATALQLNRRYQSSKEIESDLLSLHEPASDSYKDAAADIQTSKSDDSQTLKIKAEEEIFSHG